MMLYVGAQRVTSVRWRFYVAVTGAMFPSSSPEVQRVD